jgi:hypothetical protein
LYGDFREGRPPAAVLVMQFALIEQVGPPHLIYGRTVARRVDLPRASPDALVRGYGTAFAEILSQIAPEVSARAVCRTYSAATCALLRAAAAPRRGDRARMPRQRGSGDGSFDATAPAGTPGRPNPRSDLLRRKTLE